MELDINCVPSELITREVCACLFVWLHVECVCACLWVFVWTLRGLVNHESILVLERSSAEHIITVIWNYISPHHTICLMIGSSSLFNWKLNQRYPAEYCCLVWLSIRFLAKNKQYFKCCWVTFFRLFTFRCSFRGRKTTRLYVMWSLNLTVGDRLTMDTGHVEDWRQNSGAGIICQSAGSGEFLYPELRVVSFHESWFGRGSVWNQVESSGGWLSSKSSLIADKSKWSKPSFSQVRSKSYASNAVYNADWNITLCC